MKRKLLCAGAGLLTLLVLLSAGIIVSIRSGLQRYSAAAVAQLPR